MTETWRRAAQSLRDAERVYLIGYSMPLADLVSTGMISDSLTNRDISVVVVNRAPELVCESVQTATGHNASIRTSVETFASEFVEDSSRKLADAVATAGRDVPPDALVVVGWTMRTMAPVTAATRNAEGVVLTVADLAHPRPTAPRDENRAITMRELAEIVKPGDAMTALLTNGSRTQLVGIDRFRTEVGASTRWQVLIPADRALALEV
jgi:hypothetical protein